ncbi:MAG: hypothetical protein L0216_03340 [Planctomycetales bacterium]|nr:hypothetical protein [Planctomycetales bacterium]
MSDFVGREAELSLLARTEAAGPGEPLLLVGGPKVGRTALLVEFPRRRGARAGGGGPGGGGILLARVPCAAAGLSPLSFAGAVGGALALACAEADGVAAEPDRFLDPETFPRAGEGFPVRAIADYARALGSFASGARKGGDALLRAAANLADVVGEERKSAVGLLLDDLHALAGSPAAASLAAFGEVAAARRRAVLVGTARSGAAARALAAPSGPLRGLFRVHPLSPLDEEATDALVLRLGQSAGLYPPQPFLDRVWALTGGHPFYARSVATAAFAAHDRQGPLGAAHGDRAFLAEALRPDGRIALLCEGLVREACEAAGGGSTARLALAALADADRPRAGDVSARLRGGTRAFRPATEALLKTDLFEGEGDEARFADPVFRFFCARALARDRLPDLESPDRSDGLVHEFLDRFRPAARRESTGPSFRQVAALCAGRDVPGDLLGASAPVRVPRFARVQGYAFQEKDVKLYALEDGNETWLALVVWRDVPLGAEQVDVVLRWTEGRGQRVWLVARRGLSPDGQARARERGLLVSSERDLEEMTRRLGAAAPAPEGGLGPPPPGLG